MLTIASLLLGLFPVVLKNIPGISAKLQQLITDVGNSLAAVFSSGILTQPSVTTALSAWAGVIQALKADPSLPASSLAQIAQLEKIVQAVMMEDAKLAASVDWTQFNPITPVA